MRDMLMPICISSHNVTAGSFRSHLVKLSHFTIRNDEARVRTSQAQKISILVVDRLVKTKKPHYILTPNVVLFSLLHTLLGDY